MAKIESSGRQGQRHNPQTHRLPAPGEQQKPIDGGLCLPELIVGLMISILRIRGETTGCLITLRRFGQAGAAINGQ
jgi:hypothetical protein